jgi:hypothetical protein
LVLAVPLVLGWPLGTCSSSILFASVVKFQVMTVTTGKAVARKIIVTVVGYLLGEIGGGFQVDIVAGTIRMDSTGISG